MKEAAENSEDSRFWSLDPSDFHQSTAFNSSPFPNGRRLEKSPPHLLQCPAINKRHGLSDCPSFDFRAHPVFKIYPLIRWLSRPCYVIFFTSCTDPLMGLHRKMRTEMGSRLEIILFVFALFTAMSVADNNSGLCKMISCGKGSCNLTFTGGLIDVKIPRCECDAGWKKPTIGISLSFLPCVIPNCTLDASCSKKAPSSAPAAEPSPANSTGLLHPCQFALCGGGSCQKTSDFGYRCNCEAGYENLLNITAAPCVRECSLGADCSQLGINVGGNSNSTPLPAQADTSGSTISINKGVRKTLPCQIALALVSLCMLLLHR